MKRRFFIKTSAGAVAATTLLPACNTLKLAKADPANRDKDNWYNLGTGKESIPDRKKTLEFDTAVVGGGMAGTCAAIASARNGAKTVLIQDRSVLGGNGSSEIRVNVNGVNRLQSTGLPERETGIIEEILLENRLMNPQGSYSVWDHVLYDFVTREPNLTLMLNTSALEAIMSGSKIESAICWQTITETEFTINAKVFIDCSGDGLLAAKAGAIYRTGREASSEFNESFAPKEADGWQMGETIMMMCKDMGEPIPYIPPSFTIKYDGDHTVKRDIKFFNEGFWWVELGSDNDIIGIRDKNRHELMGYAHGVWDYIKNSGHFPGAANFALDWIGSIPGRRESRRFIGDHILSETDLTKNKFFEDAVSYGGWPIDEHCPGGIKSLNVPPTNFHAHFDKIYQVPFRSLYSKNIINLMFAGRNLSATHIALSSTRVQVTCSLMGHAIGIAAAMCAKNGYFPRELAQKHIVQLQEQLMKEDAFIPEHPAKDPYNLAKKTSAMFASTTSSGDVKLLLDGMSRDLYGAVHHWQSEGLPAQLQMEWEKPVSIANVTLKCDSNLHRPIQLTRTSGLLAQELSGLPPELLKTIALEARVNGKWQILETIEKNKTRLINFKFDKTETTAIRIKMLETYGAPNVKLFEVRCYES